MIDVILACFQIPQELTKVNCMKIYRTAAIEVQHEDHVKLKLKRVIFKRKLWSTEYENQYKTLYQLRELLKTRDNSGNFMGIGIFSNRLSDGGFASFLGQKVCVYGTAGITANNNRKLFRLYVEKLKHEIRHLLGGIHRDGKDFDKVLLKEQIKNCLFRGLE